MGFYWRGSDQLIAAVQNRCALAGRYESTILISGLIDTVY